MNFSKWFTKAPSWEMILQVGFDHHSLWFFPSTNRRFVSTWGMWWFVGQHLRATFWTIHFEKPFFGHYQASCLVKDMNFLSMSILQWFLNWAIHHNLRTHIRRICQFEYLDYKHTYPRVPGIVGNLSPIRYSLEHQAVCVAGFSIEMEITWSTCGGCGITSSWDDVFV